MKYIKLAAFYVGVIILGVTVNTIASAQVSYMYNYSQVPIAPVVQPYGGYNSGYGVGGTGYGYQSQQHYNYGAGQSNTTVINSRGKMAICQTINNVTTCF